MYNGVYSVQQITEKITDVAVKYGVDRVTLFGSYARNLADESSDVDLRVDKGKFRGLFQFSEFYDELCDRLQKKVDVITTDSMSPEFIQRIRSEEIVLYEAGK